MELKINSRGAGTKEVLQKQADENIYGNLSNWRGGYISDEHKRKVLSGYDKILGFIHKGIVVQTSRIKGGV
tara:strand:- start:289 stop:501 length:213 start_codon:yes stop_codon:yes gene_type:complete